MKPAALLLATLVLAGCGAQPVGRMAAAPDAAAIAAMAKRENVFSSEDLRYICEATLKAHATSQANKTNAARLETVLAHAETVARKQGNKAAAKIAKEELARQHELAQGVKGNLPKKVAEAMRQGCLDAFEAILATL